MELEVLSSPLDKGEKWEEKSKRIIEIVLTTDNQGTLPAVYFGIMKAGKKETRITEDFFFDADTALKIGKELVRLAKEIGVKQKTGVKQRQKISRWWLR